MPVKRTSLAARRKVVGFSQDELAERVRVDRSTIVRWESGESAPQPSKRVEVAKALRVSVDQLDELLTEESPAPEADNADQVWPKKPRGEATGLGQQVAEKSSRNTMLRILLKQRHWLGYKTFEAQFSRAARELSKRDEEPQLANVTISETTFERWLYGKVKAMPQASSRRVLEYMFDIPVRELLSTVSVTGNSAPGAVMMVPDGPHVPSDVVGFAGRQLERNEGVTSTELQPDIIEAVKRREFLMELAASASLGAVGLPLEATRHGLNLSVAEKRSAADADEWNQIALEYGESYLTTPPTELLKPLMVDIIGLQSALQRNPAARSHRELMGVAALLSVFTAQTLMNTGQVHEARRWWRTAKNCADRSGDPYSILWVRAREINRAPEFRPAAAVLPLVEEAEKHLDNAPADAVLSFLGAKALTLARAGRLREAENTLDQLRKRSDGVAGQSGSLLAFDRAGGLHGIESFVYSRLGNLEKTESAYESATELRDSGNMRHQADDGMKVGFCLVRKGDVTEGLRHAQTVLAQLPAQHRSQYLVGDAHELMRSIPASGQQLNATHEYREWLGSL